MDSAKSASSFSSISDVPPIAVTTTTTTVTTVTTTTGAVVTAPRMRMDECQHQATSLFLDKLMPEILGEIGRKLYQSSALRPSLNAITRINHAGESLAVCLCSKLTPTEASDQMQKDWIRLTNHFKRNQKDPYLSAVRTVAQQLPMTPLNPSEYLSDYFADITALEFIASIPQVELSCNSPAASGAALKLIQSQLAIKPESRTKITLNYSAEKKGDLFESLLAAAELHGNCFFTIVESGAGNAIASAAKKNVLRYMTFFPSSKKGTAGVTSALKGNTSLNAACIAISKPMEIDDLLLALSRLPCLHRFEIHLPGPGASPALTEMVKSSSALADLKIITSYRPSADTPTPDAAMTHARAQLKLALETRGPSFRYEIHPIYLPELPRDTAIEARKD